ncbi:uncharacterized protein LOC119389775 [Rhipicephalus sanguineus]|uniref:uncharacterized protein LOC119389775 n=1 Tax=Rhipicephalus sanguineus TaxID=34632 RepID=UPI0020C4222A|nr:uncharacterized protein LOC119389775 [Rhipicephalus sanguineus]
MRKTRAVTMLDPLQRHYGRWMGVLLCLPAVCAEIFWTATMLAALGDAAGTIMQVNSAYFVVILASIILFYTALGGYYSVSYTDVFQITSTAVFLWICVPYAAKSSAVNTLRPPHNDWVGHIPSRDIMRIVDGFLVTALGGIPWQVYFQRVLGSDSDFTAKMLSYAAAIGCLFLALPPAILGGMAKTTTFFLGAISRWLIGEPSFALTASAHTASYESDWRHRFPYGLACMTLSMTTLIAASLLVTVAFEHRWLSLRYDVFHCFSDARSAGTRHVDVTVGLGTNEALVAREALAVDKGNDKANDKSNDKVNDKGNGGSDGRIKAAVDGECERTKSGHRDKVYSRKPSKGTGGTDSAGVTESERTPSVAAISALPAGAARTVPEVAAKPARRTSTK